MTYGEAFDGAAIRQPVGDDGPDRSADRATAGAAGHHRPARRARRPDLGVSKGFTFSLQPGRARSEIGSTPRASSSTAAFSNRRPPTGSSPTASWPTAVTRSPFSPKGPTGSAAATTWWPSPSTSTSTARSPRPRIGSPASSGGGGPEGPPAGVGSHRLGFNLIFRRAFLRHAALRPPGLKRASKNQGTVA